MAELDGDGQMVVRVRPSLAFTLEQVALALAVTYGGDVRRRGPTNVPAALHNLTMLALAGEDVSAPESTVATWRERLVAWGVFPSDG